MPEWLGGEFDFPIPGIILTRRVAPGLIVYDQNFIDLQAMAWGLAAYAACPALANSAIKMAQLLGKTPETVGKLAELAMKSPGVIGIAGRTSITGGTTGGAGLGGISGVSFGFGFGF